LPPSKPATAADHDHYTAPPPPSDAVPPSDEVTHKLVLRENGDLDLCFFLFLLKIRFILVLGSAMFCTALSPFRDLERKFQERGTPLRSMFSMTVHPVIKHLNERMSGSEH
jgi:hypothetical protein